ncbi:hypothetical protein H4Q26_011243 [Puccinia striiformis f. sp. tritici PST-130]|nr:hypothetical protein H4Q26_011243 [Puccinia striiformis f. sp. tritici PST-130]
MADLEQRGYSDYERGPASAISSNYSDDMLLNKGVNVTGASSGSDIASEYNHPGGGRHTATDAHLHLDMVWLSADLLLTTHKRTSAIVQHDIGQSQAKYADELPSQLWLFPKRINDMALGYNGNDERAVAMAMRRVLKEESSDEDETDSDQSGGDMESSCGRRSPSQDQTSRKNSTTGSRAWSGGTRSKREESQERSEVNSPLPKHDHAHGHRQSFRSQA